MEAGQEPSKQDCYLSGPSPTYSITTQQCGLPHPDEYLRLHPLLLNRCAETKKYGSNERINQSSRRNTTKWWRDSHLSDEEFKTLVIRMLTEMVKYGHKVEEEVKAMLREIKEKENVQGTN